MKKHFKYLLPLIIFISSMLLGTSSNNLPKKPTSDIFFQDNAGMFSDNTKNYILSTSDDIRSKTTAEVAVVTINSLNGSTIESYANSLFRYWGIGNKEKNNGVLILISKNDRKFRIEVGYGLEGILTDGKTGSYLREMSSYFKSNKYDEGLLITYKRIISDIGQEYNIDVSNYTKDVPSQLKTDTDSPSNINSDDMGSIVKFIFVVVVILFIFFSGRRNRRHGGGGGGGSFYGGGFGDSGFGGFGGDSGGSDSFGGGDSGGGGSSGGW